MATKTKTPKRVNGNSLEREAITELAKKAGQLQRLRIAESNRIGAVERGDAIASPTRIDNLNYWLDTFQKLEDEAVVEMKEIAESFEIVQLMVGIKGISFNLAAQLLAQVDISLSNTVSQLWTFSGLGVTNGQADRRRKGEKLKYNNQLKTIMHKIGSSFLKSQSPYSDIYYSAKTYYEANRTGKKWTSKINERTDEPNKEWTKNHIHLASMRKMKKIFLSHLWEVWRAIDGLPVRNLYVEEYLGHENLLKREDFGWPSDLSVI